MSNVHDDNVILVGRLDALSEDHKRVCAENSELKKMFQEKILNHLLHYI